MKKIMILLLIIAIVAMLSMFMMTTSGLLSVENTISGTALATAAGADQPRAAGGVYVGTSVLLRMIKNR